MAHSMTRLARTLASAFALAATAAPSMATPPSAPSTVAGAVASETHDDADPYLWLEQVQGERALAWVRERNAQSRRQLEAHPRFNAMRDEFRAILDSREQIPFVRRRGDWLYNFWRDGDHPRGLWRRATLQQYRRPAPQWQTLIDLDALARAEGENWVWAGANCLGPAYRRCLVSLSRGGADASVVREFDLDARGFVAGGFALPEAKSRVVWQDRDHVYVGTDFGAGSLTDSGYPRLIKRWKRGQPLADAATVFEGRSHDVSVQVEVDRTPGFERTLFSRAIDFYRTETSLLRADGRLQALDKPADAEPTFWRGRLLIQLRSDWTVGGTTWRAGSLLVADANAYLAGERRLRALFEPTATRSLDGFATTRSRVLVSVLDDVAGRLEEWRPAGRAGATAATADADAAPRWLRRDVATPTTGTLGVTALHDPLVEDDALAEAYLLSYADFLTPDTLYLGRAGSDARERLKSRPAFFDAGGMRVEQRFATSKDGTRVPYFIVWPAHARTDAANPTLLYGYGGFEIALAPAYSGVVGAGWLRHGGVRVVANIRGGGEYGPAWHQAATLAHKQRSFDDFIAVAEDLIASKVTDAGHLAIQGGSNGGLLVGAVMLQRPELFRAVVCQVPLLDMRRYHKLLAGASWRAEYGDPDRPDEWAWISKYSPYQNVRAGVKLPQVLFITSTRDDRVHPGHARKMAARMLEQGHAPLLYENIEGGHGAAADNAQRADMAALEFAFLWQQLAR